MKTFYLIHGLPGIEFDTAKKILNNKFLILTEDNVEKLSDEIVKSAYECGDLVWNNKWKEKYVKEFYR